MSTLSKRPFQSSSQTKLPAINSKTGSMASAQGNNNNMSKLESEVYKLEQKGNLLIRKSGSEIDGIVLLEKALWARTRFGSIQGSNSDAVWQRGEQFVIICNQLASKVMQTLEEGYVHTANQLMAAAERALCNSAMDPFSGFHPLRQHLLSVTLCNHAVLQRMNGEPAQNIVATLEKALAVEDPRPSTLALLNLACAYVQAKQFDDATEMVTRCITLANHYLTLTVREGSSNAHLYKEFQVECAAHAVLSHHLIATVAQWTGGLDAMVMHHCRLALACAIQYLGKHHALTTRAINRLEAVEHNTSDLILDPEDSNSENPPLISLQLSMLSSKTSPSMLLPFTLAFPLPASVSVPPPHTANLKFPPIGSTVPNQGGAVEAAAGGSSKRGGKGGKQSARKSLSGMRKGQPQEDSIQSGITERRLVPIAEDTRPSTVGNVPGREAAGQRRAIAGTPQQKKRGGQALNAEPKVESARRPEKNPVPAPPLTARASKGQLFSRGGGGTSAASTSERGGSAALVPVPPPKEKHTSVVPKREYELYMALQQEAVSYLENVERVNTSTKRIRTPMEQTYLRQKLEASALSPSAKLASANSQLHDLSQVFPDHTDAEEKMWLLAVQRLQKWIRGCWGRKVFHHKQKRVRAHINRLGAQASIRHWWKSFQECQAARKLLEELREKKERNDAACTVQSFCRMWLSTEEYGHKVHGFYLEQKKKWDHWKLKEMSATCIQALHRGHMERKSIHKRRTAVRLLQRTIRWRRAFDICRLIIFNRRVAKRKLLLKRDKAATKLQHWGVKCMNYKKASRELHRRKDAMAAYMVDFMERNNKYWELVRDVDERECLVKLQKVCRGLLSRISLYRYKANVLRRDRAARTLQRWFSFLSAENIKNKRGALFANARAIQRRVEEVTEAVIDIQALARRFLQRIKFLQLLAGIQHKNQAACKIQRMARRANNRNLYQKQREERQHRGERYEKVQLRTYAATKIQSIYRMRRDRIAAGRFKHFMGNYRHELAQKIQRIARRFLARKKREALVEQRDSQKAAILQEELREASCQRIQAAVRMWLEKKGHHKSVTEPIEKRRAAAKVIQRRWKRFAAMSRVQQLLMARKRAEQECIDDEHRNVYALQIQARARQALLNSKKVQAARERLENKSVLTIQRVARRYLGRLQVGRLLIIREENEEREFNHEELHFAALRIQKTLRGHQKRKELQKQSDAVTVMANWFRCIKAKQVVSRMKRERDEKHQNEESEEAASSIQNAWRASHSGSSQNNVTE